MVVSNEGERDLDVTLHLKKGAITQIWDAWEGTMEVLQEPVREMRLQLKRRESRILVILQI